MKVNQGFTQPLGYGMGYNWITVVPTIRMDLQFVPNIQDCSKDLYKNIVLNNKMQHTQLQHQQYPKNSFKASKKLDHIDHIILLSMPYMGIFIYIYNTLEK
jgi:hypothetical protein